jgi:uncharacterized protein YxjI
LPRRRGVSDDHRVSTSDPHRTATVHKALVDHEYEIERDGDTVATISKKWFRVRDSYGVDVAAGEDVPLILAITVAIDSLTTRD